MMSLCGIMAYERGCLLKNFLQYSKICLKFSISEQELYNINQIMKIVHAFILTNLSFYSYPYMLWVRTPTLVLKMNIVQPYIYLVKCLYSMAPAGSTYTQDVINHFSPTPSITSPGILSCFTIHRFLCHEMKKSYIPPRCH